MGNTVGYSLAGVETRNERINRYALLKKRLEPISKERFQGISPEEYSLVMKFIDHFSFQFTSKQLDLLDLIAERAEKSV